MMALLIILNIVLIVFCFLMWTQETSHSKQGAFKAILAMGIILTLLIWLGGGAIFPINSKKIDVTNKVNIAKSEHFVVFTYKDHIIKTTDHSIVENPEKTKVYLIQSVNIYGYNVPSMASDLKLEN